MITIIVESISEWDRLREKFKIPKDETFFTFLGEGNGLAWFIKDNNKYAVKSSKPIYDESVRAKVHDN
ncbi:hypothetical protein ACFL6I_21225 [candidate division KSB1 bacterium]